MSSDNTNPNGEVGIPDEDSEEGEFMGDLEGLFDGYGGDDYEDDDSEFVTLADQTSNSFTVECLKFGIGTEADAGE